MAHLNNPNRKEADQSAIYKAWRILNSGQQSSTAIKETFGATSWNR